MDEAADVFLSHASEDKEQVKVIALQLHARGISTWLDEWNLIPGDHWQDGLEKALTECKSCAVFVGAGGLAPWHHEETRVAIDRRARNRAFRVIPVLLRGGQREMRGLLPRFLTSATWVDFSKGLEDGEALHRLVCGIRGVPPGPLSGTARARSQNPYRGLRVFDVDDAPLFFGREALVDDLLSRLGPGGSKSPRFMGILGSSGSGKSSLARAGLLAALKAGGLPGSERWPQVILRPGAHPVDSLAASLVRAIAPSLSPVEVARRLVESDRALHLQARVGLEREDRRLVVLVDQAEEIFTLCEQADQRLALLDALTYAATVFGGQTVVIIAMRADFYPRCAAVHAQFAALLSENQILVPPMTEDELRRAITSPAERAGGRLKQELVDELVSAVIGRAGGLPLLEHALAQLWQRPEPVLGLPEYRAIGGMAGALEARAEAVYASLSDPGKAACKRLFLRLIQPGEGTEDTRRRVPACELLPDQAEVSQHFAAEGVHLLIWSREGETELIELAHEELIRQWGTLREWIERDRREHRIHRRLTIAVREYQERVAAGLPETDSSFLYRGLALAEVEEWLASLPVEEASALLNYHEQQFLSRSRALRAREVRVQEETAEQLATAHRAATEQRAEALSRKLVALVDANLNGDPQLNLALLKASLALKETKQTWAAFARLANSQILAVLPHSGIRVRTAAFSSDGRRAVTACDDHVARVWNAYSGKLIHNLRGHSDWLRMAAFSPDGLRVVTACDDRTARIWDTASGKHLVTLSGHTGPVWTATFSADNLRVVTGGLDGTARVWDVSSGKLLILLSGDSRRSPVWTAAFSPDGLRVVTVSLDDDVPVWDAASGKRLVTLHGHTGSVWTAAFSPDGSRIVTGSSDRSARIWSTCSGEPLVTLKTHPGPVWAVAFSPDGLLVVTAGPGGTRIWDAQSGECRTMLAVGDWAAAFSPDGLRIVVSEKSDMTYVYDVSSGKPLATLSGTSQCVTAAFSPDGLCIITGSRSRKSTARIGATSSGMPLAVLSTHGGQVWTAAFSPDGTRVVTASRDGTARIWDAFSGKPLVTLSGHSGQVWMAAFSPESSRVVSASRDGTARVWDASSGKLLAMLSGHPGQVWMAAFSPESSRVVSASRDGTARIWDASSGKLLMLLSGHSNHVWTATFNPDGSRVLTASLDSTARIWDAASGKPFATLSGHSGALLMASFSPDGRRVVTASIDGTARLWSTDSGQLLATLSGHSGQVWMAAFSPDGLRIVTASLDGTARVWDALSAKSLATFSGHSDTLPLTPQRVDGLRMVAAGDEHTARLWDASPSKPLAALYSHSGAIWTAAFSPDGLRVVTASLDGTARVWDASSGMPLTTLVGHSGAVWTAAFSRDGLHVVTASEDGTGRIWRDYSWISRQKKLEMINAARALDAEEQKRYLDAEVEE